MNLMRYKPPSFIFQNYKLFTTLKKYTKKNSTQFKHRDLVQNEYFICLFIHKYTKANRCKQFYFLDIYFPNRY